MKTCFALEADSGFFLWSQDFYIGASHGASLCCALAKGGAVTITHFDHKEGEGGGVAHHQEFLEKWSPLIMVCGSVFKSFVSRNA